ncbi:MAG: hypothetical protein CO158_00920 [Piscirickettsiaceae bacterium CG_4_9_14_3_um_filter_43_564]|nr:hypothetical protein [Thiomicrospira sp.]PIQ03198.1 MAG: hypothetical protein COW74_07980 [Piscirickettsiaceae bacterium CG18_big_fil_WC_8_21_14_2_50_44_103]PIU39473.1 MAG: hypothetical protein COT01_01260 [Piscirickettsiaceae bacterium CG07_land_8_20_14_0_80_44_28]PIW58560.1 MAG: hypothetical protein COW14_00680 [Piscirickettsiaceae bacterium CG12_big_fil_rev_8_21_14_0_65_44_934]PIW78419.1 MAG: hypothetical protein CO000_01795 [Piscirickettsiaceae bacterium CG_4_8_14_3_um_filter_44_38]PIX7
MRALLFFGLIIVIFLLIRWLFNRRPTPESNAVSDTKQMVSCDYCGIHLPKEEAIKDAENPGQYYCSDKHYSQSKNHTG